MRDTVSYMFDFLDPFRLLDRGLQVLHHLFQETATLDHIVRGLFEQFEKGLFFRNQAEHH